MRIVFLNPIAELGGAEQVVLTAIRSLREAAPDFALHLIVGAPGPLVDEARAIGIDVSVIPLPDSLQTLGDSNLSSRGKTALALRMMSKAPAVYKYVATLRKHLLRLRPDIVHACGIKCQLASAWAAPSNVPVVWHIHDFLSRRSAASHAMRFLRRKNIRVLAVSEAVARDARKTLKTTLTTTILNAIDVTRYVPGEGQGDMLDRIADLGPAPAGTIRVGLVATFARWKGHFAVLAAAARLRNTHPELPLRWYLVGGPIYRTKAQVTSEELRRAVTQLQLNDQVGFVPFSADTPAIYRSLDIVVHASTSPEPFGLVIAEAMACGRPTIVSAAGGATELFTEGVDAVGVPPNDEVKLAEAVHRLATDDALRRRLGIAARTTATARFSAPRYGAELAKFYQHLLNDE